MVVKEMEGYILGVDNTKMYAVITDNDKSYQLDCEYELLGLDKENIIPERKFKMLVDENDDVTFEFLDSYINEGVTIEYLKKLKGIEE
jgi:hypothetical protein